MTEIQFLRLDHINEFVLEGSQPNPCSEFLILSEIQLLLKFQNALKLKKEEKENGIKNFPNVLNTKDIVVLITLA